VEHFIDTAVKPPLLRSSLYIEKSATWFFLLTSSALIRQMSKPIWPDSSMHTDPAQGRRTRSFNV
jgi:hypothetical protein